MFISDYRNVTLLSGFWKQKEDLNRDVTIDAVYNRFDETGRVAAFKCDWKEGDPKQPHFFWDSDIAKWMEGAAYILKSNDRPDLMEKVEWLIDQIEKNQGEDGYFNIFFTVVQPEKRFTTRDWHELYCAGHLMEAACAYYEATGRDRMLKLMEKYADYIRKVFVEDKSAGFTTPGHEEIELALYRMYKTTGQQKYLDLCEFFLENRGQPRSSMPLTMPRAMLPSVISTKHSVIPYAQPTSTPVWLTSPAKSTTKRSLQPAATSSTTLPRRRCTSPAVSAPPTSAKRSPSLTTFPMRTLTPKPAPPSA